ncbi:MAG: siderophore ferric iron reductase [Gammaproteobacteria bacterium]|nr:siderophore ferric iron reductase [Gammaproteobacteria bacterium]
MSLDKYSQFFQTAISITPLLDGRIGTPETSHFKPQQDSQVAIQSLYQYWQQQHPEAGSSYWLTRTWTMLIWQPLYLAFVGVYATQTMPKLSAVGQFRGENGLISGYVLPEVPLLEADSAQLVTYSGQQLQLLFNDLRAQFDLQYRIRPGFVAHLLADTLLVNLISFQALRLDLNVYQQAQAWMVALGLSDKHLSALYQPTNADGRWAVKRISCCMHYRRADGDLCSNCPKLKSPRAKTLIN